MIHQKAKTLKLSIAVAFCVMLFASCNKNVIYSKYETLENYDWFRKNKLVFETDIADGQSLYDVSIMVRHAESYPYSNLFVFLTTQYPDGKSVTDTLECVLANSKGEWIGDGSGEIFDITLPLKKSVRFPLTGKYKFSFEQGMRTDPLPLIMDFGMEIKKVSGN